MNNEIKESIEVIRDSYDETIPKQEFNRYLKYIEEHITNLQKENENNIKMLNDIIKEQDMRLNDLQQEKEIYYENFKDYKSRCEKEIEYIQNHQLVFELSSKKVISQWFDMFYKDSLNILNGRSDK